MKKYIVLTLIISAALLCDFVTKKNLTSGHHRIAILTPVTHSALQEIIFGFKDTLQKKLTCDFDLYNAHGDRILLRNQAEKIVQHGYDLAFVVATQPSIIIKEVTAQRRSPLPVVCAAVDDPIKNGIIASCQSSGNNITTVTESNDLDHYEKQIALLVDFLPSVKKLLLVYTPSIMLDKEMAMLAQSCADHDISLSIAPIYASHELALKVAALMPGHDCVIILKDNAIVSCIETLINLCHRMKIPLYASDLNSLSAGATCAFGVTEYEFGVEAAHKAFEILHNKRQPSDIASSSVNNPQFKINKQVLTHYGIPAGKEYHE